jgi:hypothetical protein
LYAPAIEGEMRDRHSDDQTLQARTGVAGLDDILAGGLQRERVYLLEGNPGTGKTTAALRFLLTGAERGERGLYVSLSETETSSGPVPRRIGWALDGVDLFELVPPESLLDEQAAAEPALLLRPRARRDDAPHPPSGRDAPAVARWCSTACRRSGSSRKARCAIAARSWR